MGDLASPTVAFALRAETLRVSSLRASIDYRGVLLMAVLQQAWTEPGAMVKRVKVAIGDDWTEHCFARPVPREQAVQRAREILDALS